MRLTKFAHSCVRLAKDGGTLVIDPGPLGGTAAAAAALEGADAVLITHEHWDHVDVDAVSAALAAKPGLTVWTNPSVAAQFGAYATQVHEVREGDSFDVAGFGVKIFGQHHARIHKDIPGIPNVAFLVDDQVFHPGDSFTVPAVEVDTLLVPASGPWMKIGEMIDFYRDVSPARGFVIHEAILNDAGLNIVDRMTALAAQPSGTTITRLSPGDAADL
jgi:L-ascorbate metabolism protein UlaG (beta-lactamase superfamily)